MQTRGTSLAAYSTKGERVSSYFASGFFIRHAWPKNHLQGRLILVATLGKGDSCSYYHRKISVYLSITQNAEDPMIPEQ